MPNSILIIITAITCVFSVCLCYMIADCNREEKTSKIQFFLSIIIAYIIGMCVPNIVNYILN